MTLNPLSPPYLGLHSRVLPLQDLIECPPLPTDVVHVHPGGRKLETLAIQDLLSRMEHLYIQQTLHLNSTMKVLQPFYHFLSIHSFLPSHPFIIPSHPFIIPSHSPSPSLPHPILFLH